MKDSDWKKALAKGRCPKGCSITDKTCLHLDFFLSNGKSVKTIQMADIESFLERSKPIPEPEPSVPKFTQSEISRQLENYGLIHMEIVVLVESFYNGASCAQIAKEYGFSNKWSVYRVKKKAIAKLKACGFELEKRKDE